MKTELFVGLVIPDTTAITTFKTLKKIGIPIKSLKRYEYYAFESDTDMFDQVSTCDVLVNVNKHKAFSSLDSQNKLVLVKDKEPAEGMRKMLNARFGFKINKLEKGIVWEIEEGDYKKITEELLHNPHYQEYVIL